MVIKYRPDVDGLRAVAVLSVVAFHFKFLSIAPGGYVGVDVFFVISGYLITKIIASGIATDTYSLLDFYHRRILRIFPALLLVVAACGVFEFSYGFPYEVEEFTRSLTAASLFMSNIYFYFSTDYFNDHVNSSPLLHTWSLAVEEQFYIFFPLLMIMLAKVSHRTRLIWIWATALASLLAATIRIEANVSGVFYLVQFRAWELLAGSIVALSPGMPKTWRWAREALTLGGLAAIAFSVKFYDGKTLFPGLAALPPVVGTALIIYAGGSGTSLVTRLLSLRPIVGLGLISYSLYLWHWPLVVYYTRSFELSFAAKVTLVFAALALATLSWWFVERPFRNRSAFRVAPTMAGGLGLMAGFVALSFIGQNVAQYLWPMPAAVTKATALIDGTYDSRIPMRSGSCFLSSSAGNNARLQAGCLKISESKRNILILGDSHAAHLWSGMQEAIPELNFLQATASGCKPILPVTGNVRCTDAMNDTIKGFLPQNKIDGIILSARWTKEDVEGAISTAKALRRHANRVYIFGPILEYDQMLPRLVATAYRSEVDPASLAESHREEGPRITDEAFAAVELPTGVEYVSVYNALCMPHCRVTLDDGSPLQFDYGHLTADGSRFLAGALKPLFETSVNGTVAPGAGPQP